MTEIVKERLKFEALARLCEKYSVIRLSVFGSVLGDNFEADSDIDFVVEFGPSTSFSLPKQYFGFLADLEDMYGRNIDLVQKSAIKNPVFLLILDEREVLVYAA